MKANKEKLLSAIGKRIHDVRKLHGLSQAELAEKADLSVVYISNIESGKKNFSVDVLIRLCVALDISSGFLLCLDLRRSEWFQYDISAIFADCSDNELKDILIILRDIKIMLNKAKTPV